jgi:uracil-DNA glycosylase family 4
MKSASPEARLGALNQIVINCRNCPRLVDYREEIARTKRRAYRDWTYWGRPVPGFGDPRAELLLLGLAPGAHGSNRTGRMFTGDASGTFLYAQLYRAGFANQPNAISVDDGLKLHNTYITAVARCAPPDNKPLPIEIANCSGYLEEELDILRPRVILALGAIAFNTYLRLLIRKGQLPKRALVPSDAPFRFSHAAEYKLPTDLPWLFASYHPSQQNTQTGRLTPEMFATVLRRIRRVLSAKH